MWKLAVEPVQKPSAGKASAAPAAAPLVTPADAVPQPLIFPDELPELIEAPRRRPRDAAGQVARTAGVLALGALALVGAASLLPRLTPAAGPPAPLMPQPVVNPAPLPDPTASSGAVWAAVASFEMRQRMFASRQMQCDDLARGLVLLEERWTAYSTAHPAGVGLDSSGVADDKALYARVDQVERQFERTGCPRP